MLNQTQSKLICLSKPKWVSCEIEYRTAEKWKSMLIKMWFLLLTTLGSRTPNLVEWYLININLKFIILIKSQFQMSSDKGMTVNSKCIRRSDSNVKPSSTQTNESDKSCNVGCFSMQSKYSQVYFSRIVGCSQEGQ